jgi:hypothetical protein
MGVPGELLECQGKHSQGAIAARLDPLRLLLLVRTPDDSLDYGNGERNRYGLRGDIRCPVVKLRRRQPDCHKSEADEQQGARYPSRRRDARATHA